MVVVVDLPVGQIHDLWALGRRWLSTMSHASTSLKGYIIHGQLSVNEIILHGTVSLFPTKQKNVDLPFRFLVHAVANCWSRCEIFGKKTSRDSGRDEPRKHTTGSVVTVSIFVPAGPR